jgi:hypothetical protein
VSLEVVNGILCHEEDEPKGYADAEAILDGWNYHSLPDGNEVIWAIEKAMQALRACQEMGLDGVGE